MMVRRQTDCGCRVEGQASTTAKGEVAGRETSVWARLPVESLERKRYRCR